MRATDAASNASEERTLTVTTLAAAAPGSAPLFATARAGGLADLSWDAAPADGLDGYTVLRAAGDGAFAPVGQVSTTAFTDSGLDAQTTYRWVVQAVRDGIAGPHTAEAAATTPALTVLGAEAVPVLIGRALAFGSELALTLRGEANRAAAATVGLVTTGGEAADTVVPLTESAPGTYTGSLAVPDGTARVGTVSARLRDLAGHEATAVVAVDRDVSGAVALDVDAPPGSMPGAHLEVHSPTSGHAARSPVDPGRTLVPLLPAPDYAGLLVRGDGPVAAEVSPFAVTAGSATVVPVTPVLPASLTVSVTTSAGLPPPPTQPVTVEDAATGAYIGSPPPDFGGTYGPVEGLDSGTQVLVRTSVQGLDAEPEPVTVTLQPGPNHVTFAQTPLPPGELTGVVTDAAGNPLAGARLSLSQTVDGRGFVFRAESAADGTYDLGALAGPGRLGVHRPPYASVYRDVTVAGATAHDVALDSPVVYDVLLQVFTETADGSVAGPLDLDLSTAGHLRVRVDTPTGEVGARSERVRVRATPGGSVRLCADGFEAGLPAACSETLTLGTDLSPALTLRLVQVGRVVGTLADAAGGLYSGAWRAEARRLDGPLVGYSEQRGAGADLDVGLPQAGEYEVTVVADRRRSRPVRVVIPEGGATVDLGTVLIGATGPFAGVGNAIIPSVAEVAPGGLVQLRTSLVNGGAALSGAVVALEVPPGTTLVPGGVTLNGVPVPASVAEGFAEVVLGSLPRGATATLTHVLAVPQPEVRERVTVAARVRAGTQEHTIGTAAVSVVGVTIDAPPQTAERSIVASGRGPRLQQVDVWAGAELLGRAGVSPGGYWRLPVTLPDLGRGHEHRLHATATVDGLPARSRDVWVTYDDTLPLITSVTMTNRSTMTFDPRGGVARFPFVIDRSGIGVRAVFADATRVENVEFTIGGVTARASGGGGNNAFAAAVPVRFGEEGPVYVAYDELRPPLPLADPANPAADEAGARARLPHALADFAIVDVVPWTQGAAGETADVAFALPSLGPDATGEASMTITRGVAYTPTAEDAERERAIGLPVYGLEVEYQPEVGPTAFRITALIPEAALGSGGDARSGFAQVGEFAEIVFETVTTYGDISEVIEGGNKYHELDNLEDYIATCDEEVRDAYRDQVARRRAEAHTNDGINAFGTIFFTGVALLAAGPLAGVIIWGVTEALSSGFEWERDRRFQRTHDAIVNDPACLQHIRRGDALADPRYIYDPSGVVFEAVRSNRLAGVTATLSERQPDGRFAVWDAVAFGQVNPLTTGADGAYGWDVPPGHWQVAWTAEGYETGRSEVLEVLPPHVDVDHGMVFLGAPTVTGVTALADPTTVDVTFDRYMQLPATTAAIAVRDAAGAVVVGSVEAVDAEDAPSGEPLARTFRFTASEPFGVGDVLTVAVAQTARSYAPRMMAADVTRTVTVAARPPAPPGPAEPPAPPSPPPPPLPPPPQGRDEVVEVAIPAPGGGPVTVTAETSAGPVTVTFTGLAGAGTLRVTLPADAPHQRGLVLLPTWFRLDADVVFAAAEVCVPYARGAGDPAMGALALFHVPDGGTVADVTSAHDRAADQLCGSVTGFSAFLVGATATTRLAGADRYATAAAVSAARFAAGVELVFVATGEDFPDALAGGPEAARAGAPVLLVTRDALPAVTAAELRRLAPGGIVVLGGTAAVSSAVEQELAAIAPVTRLAGPDRFATAAAIAARSPSTGGTVYVATGLGFADALAGGAAAAREGAPLLLVSRDGVPPVTSAALASLAPARLVVLGGTAAVSDAVAAELVALTGAALERLAGQDRYGTAAAVAARFPSQGPATVATGEAFPDALAGVPVTAGGPLLLTAPHDLPDPTAQALAALEPSAITVLGGTAAVSRPVEVRLAGLLP